MDWKGKELLSQFLEKPSNSKALITDITGQELS